MKPSSWNGLREAAAVECPTCGKPIPFAEPKCPNCGNPPTITSAFRATFGTLKTRLEARAVTASPEMKRRIQWCYLALSAIILLILLPLAKGHFVAQAVSLIYLTAISAYLVWLSPTRWRRAYFQHASGIVKLASTFNFLSLLMLIQIAIRTWWGSALHLGLLFLIAFAAGYLLLVFVIPVAHGFYIFLMGMVVGRDPREQGRTVYRDKQ